MLKKLVLAAMAALISTAAIAADLPVKAPAYTLPTYPTASGWFWGVSASGLGGTTSSTGGLASGNLVGGKVGIDGGYTGVVGSTFWFIEQSISAQAIQGPASGLSLSATVNFEQRYAVGLPANIAAKYLSVIPGLSAIAMPSVPALPSGLTLGPSNWYGFAATYEDDVSASIGTSRGQSWLFSYGLGVGVLNRVSNGMMLDTSIEWKHGSAGLLIGSAVTGSVEPFADSYLATVRLKF